MYIIEMINGDIYEADLGKLANKCISIARTLVDNERSFCNLKSLTFVNRGGAEAVFSGHAIIQLKDKIEAYQSEMIIRDEQYTEYNKHGDNFTDGHYRGMTC